MQRPFGHVLEADQHESAAVGEDFVPGGGLVFVQPGEVNRADQPFDPIALADLHADQQHARVTGQLDRPHDRQHAGRFGELDLDQPGVLFEQLDHAGDRDASAAGLLLSLRRLLGPAGAFAGFAGLAIQRVQALALLFIEQAGMMGQQFRAEFGDARRLRRRGGRLLGRRLLGRSSGDVQHDPCEDGEWAALHDEVPSSRG